jgi:hypothetical protein
VQHGGSSETGSSPACAVRSDAFENVLVKGKTDRRDGGVQRICRPFLKVVNRPSITGKSAFGKAQKYFGNTKKRNPSKES